jgi:hypothetical protein
MKSIKEDKSTCWAGRAHARLIVVPSLPARCQHLDRDVKARKVEFAIRRYIRSEPVRFDIRCYAGLVKTMKMKQRAERHCTFSQARIFAICQSFELPAIINSKTKSDIINRIRGRSNSIEKRLELKITSLDSQPWHRNFGKKFDVKMGQCLYVTGATNRTTCTIGGFSKLNLYIVISR